MILCGLLILLVGLLDALFALLPSWDWTLADVPTTGNDITMWNQSGIAVSGTSALEGPWLALARCNRFVPVDHLLYAVQFLGIVVAAALIFRGVKFVINVIRGAGA